MPEEDTPPPPPPPPPPPGGGRFVVPDPGGPPEGAETATLGSTSPPPAPASPPPAPTSPPPAPTSPPPALFPPTAAQDPATWAPGPRPDPADEPRSRVAPWIVGLVVAVLAAIASFVVVTGVIGGPSLEGEVVVCTIDADGSLSAGGWVRTGSDAPVAVEVTFEDAGTGEPIDRVGTFVEGGADEQRQWEVAGAAPPTVDRVTCILEAGDGI